MVPIARVEASPVRYDDMRVIWILLLDLVKEGFGPIQIHCRCLQEDSLTIDHVDGSVAVTPAVLAFPAFMRTQPFLRPDPAQVR